MTSGSWTWLLILLFVVILGVAIRYGVMMTRRRRLDRSAEAHRDEATRELYTPPPTDATRLRRRAAAAVRGRSGSSGAR